MSFNIDTIKHSLFVGTSVCMSWFGAIAILFGLQVARTKGAEAFLIWAFANCTCVYVFWQAYKHGILNEKIIQNKLFLGLMLVLQLTYLLNNIVVMRTAFTSVGLDSFLAAIVAVGVAVIFIVAMLYKGLRTSMVTDNYQGAITIGILVALLIGCVSTDANHITINNSTETGIMWGLWSSCILYSTFISDIQHWQRAKINNNSWGFECGMVIFAVILGLIYWLAHYEIPQWGNWLICIAVLGASTSTIDSVAVAFHKCYNKWVGTALCCGFALLSFTLVDIGLLKVWSTIGIYRVALGVLIIALGLYWKFKPINTN